jgi:hypothetical protein
VAELQVFGHSDASLDDVVAAVASLLEKAELLASAKRADNNKGAG